MIKKTRAIQILTIGWMSVSLIGMPTENITTAQINSAQIITQNVRNKTVTTNHIIKDNQAPLFKAKTIKRKAFSLEKALEDGPVIINFWATWCTPCIDEMQALKKIKKELKKKKITVVSISIDEINKLSKVKSMVKKYRFPFKIIHDSNKDIYRLFGASNVPATYIINQNQDIMYQHIGFNKEAKDACLDTIKKM